jgi:tRNA(Ile)-lysidine synthase
MPVTGNSPRYWVPRPPAHLGEAAVKQGPVLWREKITGSEDDVAAPVYHRGVMAATALDSLAEAIRSSGLIANESSGVALCSGGADSAALAAGLAEVLGSAEVLVLHLNYGLRPDSDRDEAVCRELCERFGLELVVERPRLGEGNVQAAAREARYAAADALRRQRGLDWVATGHTRTDLAETVIYRLAAAPGRRSLLGLPPRRGVIVRPLLGLDRDRVRALATEAELPFRDDPTNADPLYARNRIRNEILPVLRELSPAVEQVIAETQAELAEESEVLEASASEALRSAGAETGGVTGADALAGLPPALRRLALRALAERAAGRPVPLSRERAAAIWRLAQEPEGGVIELGGGVEAQIEHGHIRFRTGPSAEPEERALPIPGACRFGPWEVRAELGGSLPAAGGVDRATLDPDRIGETLRVRSWRDGDRIRPLGLGGSKSLQDLFTDRKVPRSLRRTLPVVTAGDRIAWIAGVAVSEEFAAPPDSERVAVLSASIVDT